MKPINLSNKAVKNIIKGFHREMSKGLCGRKSSLAMLPTFTNMPDGNEKGAFIALDLGGTNFRIMEVRLEGRGKIRVLREKKFHLKNEIIAGTQKRLFGFLAECVKRFATTGTLGFTFSFPVRQTSIKNGVLLCWNKGFSAKNAVGRDVVQLLNNALKRKGVRNIHIAALINDTIGTLVTKRYNDPDCDLGVILGTGTNASYPQGGMAINIEWGNFNRLPRTAYDKKLDASTVNPGKQMLEKMVSGMYLGEIARLILADEITGGLARPWEFKTSHVSLSEGDRSKNLDKIKKLLKGLDAKNSSYADRLKVKRVCAAVSGRSAQIITAAIAAVILWMDPKIKRNHTVAIDGSLFEKWPEYRGHMKIFLREILNKKAAKISLELIKNGSGKGAAIVAATASSHPVFI